MWLITWPALSTRPYPKEPPVVGAAAAAAADADAALYRGGWRRGDVGKGAEPWTPDEEAALHRLREGEQGEQLPWEQVSGNRPLSESPPPLHVSPFFLQVSAPPPTSGWQAPSR